ncbi:hypothetical protein ACWDD9_43225 [Kitasatospora sp. NPDC001119]
MRTVGDDLNELIDAWVEEQLALSLAWTVEKMEAILALLGESICGLRGIGGAASRHLPQAVDN